MFYNIQINLTEKLIKINFSDMKREIKFRYWSKNDNKMIYDIQDTYDWELINHDECMQYTGLKDKNGKEIYEGDILSNGINCKGAVYYINGMFLVEMIYIEHILSKDNDTATFRLISAASITEIIGNIYENKELLK